MLKTWWVFFRQISTGSSRSPARAEMTPLRISPSLRTTVQDRFNTDNKTCVYLRYFILTALLYAASVWQNWGSLFLFLTETSLPTQPSNLWNCTYLPTLCKAITERASVVFCRTVWSWCTSKVFRLSKNPVRHQSSFWHFSSSALIWNSNIHHLSHNLKCLRIFSLSWQWNSHCDLSSKKETFKFQGLLPKMSCYKQAPDSLSS